MPLACGDINVDRLQVIAHRGSTRVGTRTFRENTLAAFAEAARLGADGVELDVRASRDGRLVVHHDALLEDGRVVADTEFRDLPSYVPGLGEVLDVCGGMLVNIEVKSDPREPGFSPGEATARSTARLLVARRAEGRGGPVVVSSFSRAALAGAAEELAQAGEELAQAGGELARAGGEQARSGRPPGIELALLAGPAGGPAAEAVRWAADRELGGFHPHFLMVDADLVALAGREQLAVRSWTVDLPAEVARLAALGVDAVVTNDVGMALQVLGRR